MPRNPDSPHNHPINCGPIHTHTSASENIKLQIMRSKLEESLKDEFVLKEQLKTINSESLVGEGNIEINCVSSNPIPFIEDKYVTNPIGLFTVGESVKGLTVAEIFAKLLGLRAEKPGDNDDLETPSTPQEILESLATKGASVYTYDENDNLVLAPATEPVTWTEVQAANSSDLSTTYIIKDTAGAVVEAGYQQVTTYSSNYWLTVALPSEVTTIKVKLYDPDVANWVEPTWHMVPAEVQSIEGYTIWTVPEEFEVDSGATYRFVIIN